MGFVAKDARAGEVVCPSIDGSAARMRRDPVVDVIVPVYGGEADTRRCLASVRAACGQIPFELVVVDDASPDAELAGWLDAEAAGGRITLLRNGRNIGFVASANRGMAFHPSRDVVLLNSDTEVAGNWLDRLVRCADAAPDIATVTPFSNNATICSYPFDGWSGELPGSLGLAGLDGMFGRVLAGTYIELPTAVGFCMFIRRACLDQIGMFDERAFGRGYGEENDFSLRALKTGWRNMLCADTFVYHRGGVSFGATREALMQAGARALLAKHPDYDERVSSFLLGDPLRRLRDAIDNERVILGAGEASSVLAERLLERDGLRHALMLNSRGALSGDALPMIRKWRELLDESASRLRVSSRGWFCRVVIASICRQLSMVLTRWVA